MDIYLLSSQKASDGVIPAFIQRVAQWPGMLERKPHIYDARRIAEVIVDELLPSDSAIEDFVEHLPVLAKLSTVRPPISRCPGSVSATSNGRQLGR